MATGSAALCLVCGGPGANTFGLCPSCDAQAAAELAAEMEQWRAARELAWQEEQAQGELAALAGALGLVFQMAEGSTDDGDR